jgi:CubicO group peptidase (beta-lactamase class C family)
MTIKTNSVRTAWKLFLSGPGSFLCIWLAGLCGSRADRIDDYLQTQMKQHGIAGASLLVAQNGQAVKTAGYGFANIELRTLVRPETVFEIGSLTKQFTAAGMLLLQQDGKLSVDDKVSRYLREAPAAWKEITLRHLLTHTSGLKNYTGLDGFELRRHLNQAQFIELIRPLPFDFQPGTSWKYCNTGYNLLGFVIENVSGKGYWDFMSERLFQPLAMTATTNRLPSIIIPNRAAGYEQTNHVLINRDSDLTDVFSAGALVSTVLDLERWNQALDGEKLLTPASKEQMWRPMKLSNGNLTKYGFGWFIDFVEGHQNIGHSGSTSGFSASIQRFPSERLVVILLTNTDEQIATSLARRIAMLFLEEKK